MTPREIEVKAQELRRGMTSTANRIRRYSLDRRLNVPATDRTPEQDRYADVAARLDAAWKQWLAVRDAIVTWPTPPTENDVTTVATQWLDLDHSVDLIQRELVSNTSTWWGVATVLGLIVATLGALVAYLFGHGALLNLADFEPWPEWGPAKYGEVAYWSFFGVMCTLLYTAAYFVSRRDFDRNFVTWYATTALRAPLLVVILMIVVLEFVEWYAEDTWLANYILEEGNKFYFIVFMSFCLGISSESTAKIIGDLSAGVSAAVQGAVRRIAERLGAVVSDADVLRR
jgi:hypothetical protein